MSGSGVNLGDVSFGLRVDTSSLDPAAAKLAQFSSKIDVLEKNIDKSTRTAVAAFTRQEKSIYKLVEQVNKFQQQAQNLGLPTRQIEQGSTLLRAYTEYMTKGVLSSREFSRASSQAAEGVRSLNKELSTHKQITATLQKEMSRDFTKAVTGLTATSGAPKAGNTALADMLRSEAATAEAIQKQMAQSRVAAVQRIITTPSTARAGNTALADMLRREEQQVIESANRMAQARVAAIQRMTQPTGLKASQTAFADMLRAEEAAGKVSKFASAMRSVEGATILVAGPLSGIGFRMAVLANIMESASVQTALFTVGVAAAAGGVALFGTAAVKANIQWEQWVASMSAATGSHAMVAEEMDYVIDLSSRLGQNIRATIPAYTQFATSARLSNASLKDQHNIFESLLTAGAALHWNTDKVGRAFLAVEQMFSKGTIQAQELKLQLGQVLPGAFELFAKAAGMSQREFMKAMEQGTIYTNEYLPKAAELIKKVYESAAQLGSQSTQSDIERFNTNTFMLSKAFDEASGASYIFHEALKATNSILKYLAENMSNVIGVSAGIVAFFVGLSSGAVIRGVMALGTAVRGVAAAMVALNLATMSGPWGFVIGAIARVAAGLYLGVTAYNLMTRATNAQTSATTEYVKTAATEIAILKELGSMSKREAEQRIASTQTKIKAAQAELATMQAHYKAFADQHRKESKSPVTQVFSNVFKSVFGMETDFDKEKNLLEGLAQARNNLGALHKQLETLKSIKVEPDHVYKGTDTGKAKIESLRDTIHNLITDMSSAEERYKTMLEGNPAVLQQIDAAQKAKKLLEKVDTSGKKAIDEVLRQAGYDAGTLEQRLTSVILTTNNFSEASDRLSKIWEQIRRDQENLPGDRNAIAQLFGDIDESTKLAELESTSESALNLYKRNIARMKELNNVWETVTKNSAMPFEEMVEHWDNARQKLQGKWGAEDILQSAKALESVDQFLASHKSSVEQINEAYEKRIAIVQQAGLSEEQTAQRIKALNDQRFKDMLSDGDSYMGKVHGMLRSAASSTTQAIANMFAGIGGSAREFFRNIIMQLLNLVVEMQIVKPMFEWLFGSMYTGKQSTGMGIFGSFLSAFAPGAVGFGSGAALSTAMGSLGTNAFSQQSLMLAAQVAHTGGIAGTGGTYRTVPSDLFLGAQRYHSGLKAGEVPAILESGESVVTQEQMRSLGGVTNVFHINVTANKGATEEDGQRLGKGMMRELEGLMNSWASKQLRPGGILSNA